MAELEINSLKPNSHKYKAEKARGEEAQKSRERISPVVKHGQVVSTKKPIGKKFAETFMTEDAKDVKSWLVLDVLIPGIKNTILDLLSMAFFGEVDTRNRRWRSRRDEKYDRTDYGSYYRSSSDRIDRASSRRRREDRYDSDDRVDFRNIVLRNREDAERVIGSMRNRIIDNGGASVADLLDLIDVTSRYTDNNWGWDDERDIGIRRVSSGYLIDVSEPKYLD